MTTRPPKTFRYRGPGFEAFLAIDAISNGMAFGGCRVAPDVDEAMVTRLAQAMTQKLRPHGSPTGGAKAGIRLIPEEADRTAALRGFAQAAADQLRSQVIIGKDMGATDETLDTIYDTLGCPQLAVPRARHRPTHLPSRIRELRGYIPHMTGRGVAGATQAFFNSDIEGKTVAIQGAGAVGIGTALRLTQAGARVVAISDIEQALVNKRGLDETALENLAPQRTLQRDRTPPGSEFGPAHALFDIDADVIVLAAASNCVTQLHAERMRCAVVVEGANFPLTAAATEVLARRGIPVVPDVVANSSSAALVCTQMAEDNGRDPDELWKRIDQTIAQTTQRIRDGALQYGTTLRAQLPSPHPKTDTNP